MLKVIYKSKQKGCDYINSRKHKVNKRNIVVCAIFSALIISSTAVSCYWYHSYTAQASILNQKVNNYHIELSAKTAQISKLNKTSSQLSKALQDEKSQCNKLEQSNENYQSQIKSLQQDIQTKSNKIESLQEQLKKINP